MDSAMRKRRVPGKRAVIIIAVESSVVAVREITIGSILSQDGTPRISRRFK